MSAERDPATRNPFIGLGPNPDPYRARLLAYERRKAEWARTHPSATPAEYERAIGRICRELGV